MCVFLTTHDAIRIASPRYRENNNVVKIIMSNVSIKSAIHSFCIPCIEFKLDKNAATITIVASLFLSVHMYDASASPHRWVAILRARLDDQSHLMSKLKWLSLGLFKGGLFAHERTRRASPIRRGLPMLGRFYPLGLFDNVTTTRGLAFALPTLTPVLRRLRRVKSFVGR